MSYENPYVRIPDGGSTLDAMERAKLPKDVHGEKDVGHIALAAGANVNEGGCKGTHEELSRSTEDNGILAPVQRLS